jgi:hypothetical protein
MECVRDRNLVEFTANEVHYNRRVRRSNFKRNVMLGEERPDRSKMIGYEMGVLEVKLNKPVYLGISVLDLSKLHMQRFHYDFIKAKYGENAKLCYTDTDSFVYHIKTDDLYEDMYNFRDDKSLKLNGLFDLSAYPKDSKYHDTKNKKLVGYMKDELNGEVMTEIVALRAKCYSFKKDDGEYKNTNKGTSKTVNKNELTFDDYCTSLEKQVKMERVNIRIASTKHELYTLAQTKTALNPFDDKRFLLNDGISTLAYGHKRIEQLKKLKPIKHQGWKKTVGALPFMSK